MIKTPAFAEVMKIICALLALTSAKCWAACQASDITDNIKFYQTTLSNERHLNPSWFNHRLSEYPTFVFDTDSGNHCGALWLPGSGWQLIETKNSYVPYPGEDFAYTAVTKTEDTSGQPSKAFLDELTNLLPSYSIPSAFLWVWDKSKTDPFAGIPDMTTYAAKAPAYQAEGMRVALHEAFHLFVQDTSMMGKSWSRFATEDIVSDETLQACYLATPEIRALHYHEVQALMQAFLTKDDSLAKNFARNYISLREQRYALAPEITEHDGPTPGRTHSCREEEAKQELNEGVPQYVGSALILDLAMTTKQQIADDVLLTTHHKLFGKQVAGERPICSYYYTGSVSLLLIRRFYKGDFLELTKAISQPDADSYVEDLLKDVVTK